MGGQEGQGEALMCKSIKYRYLLHERCRTRQIHARSRSVETVPAIDPTRTWPLKTMLHSRLLLSRCGVGCPAQAVSMFVASVPTEHRSKYSKRPDQHFATPLQPEQPYLRLFAHATPTHIRDTQPTLEPSVVVCAFTAISENGVCRGQSSKFLTRYQQ